MGSQTEQILKCTKSSISSPIKISTLDIGRIREFDNFYHGIQLHREQYKDGLGALHPLEYFNKGIENSLTLSYFQEYQVPYINYKVPIVLSSVYDRTFKLAPLPERKNLSIHDRSNCIKYKQ